MRKLLLIVNPISGSGKESPTRSAVASRVCLKLCKAGFDARIHYTRGPGDAFARARMAANANYYGVIACGGDGTVNEVGAAIAGSKTALGIIPLGSGNGLARHIEVPIDAYAATRVIIKDNVHSCDYATVNGRPFFCTFGVGFDAVVSHDFARRRGRGLINYLKAVIDNFRTYKPEKYTISHDGRLITEEAFCLVCANASQYGNNAYIAPEASIVDGLLDVTIVHPGSTIQQARVGFDLLAGLLYKNNRIDTFRTAGFSIFRRGSSKTVHLDGEPTTMGPRLDIECHPGKLRIFIPTRTTRFVPIITPAWCNIRNAFLFLTRPFRAKVEEARL